MVNYIVLFSLTHRFHYYYSSQTFFGIQIFTEILILLAAFEASSPCYFIFKFSSAFDMSVNFKIFTTLSLLVLNEAQPFKGPLEAFLVILFCTYWISVLVFNSSREVRVCQGNRWRRTTVCNRFQRAR